MNDAQEQKADFVQCTERLYDGKIGWWRCVEALGHDGPHKTHKGKTWTVETNALAASK